MFPRVFGVAAQQINLFVITAIASTVASGAIAVFNFSNNLQSLPVGLVGVSLAVAAFPSLARNIAEKQKESFISNFSVISRQILLFSLPVSILIFLLRNFLVELVYKTGRFAVADSQLTAACLGLFALSIFAQSLIPLLVRAFFSFQDTKTPTLITLACVAVNIGLSFFLVHVLQTPGGPADLLSRLLDLSPGKELGVLGLPLAFSFSAVLQFALLQLTLKRKIKSFF
jgi:putative peptidoglycan lipid II flippase